MSKPTERIQLIYKQYCKKKTKKLNLLATKSFTKKMLCCIAYKVYLVLEKCTVRYKYTEWEETETYYFYNQLHNNLLYRSKYRYIDHMFHLCSSLNTLYKKTQIIIT